MVVVTHDHLDLTKRGERNCERVSVVAHWICDLDPAHNGAC